VRKQQEAQAEREAQAKARSQKQLEYVKLTELSKSKDLASSSSGHSTPSQSHVQVLVSRLRYVVGLSAAYIRQNGVVLVAVLAVALISLKVINYRKLNLRERIAETVKMALKVTYM
jgi:Flp pilus assembly protein TadB